MLKKLIPLLLLIALALCLRLYKIDNPLADWHSFRQADTASVTREYLKNGIDFLHPHYQDLSNIQSGKDNPEGLRMVEFPILNTFTAWLIITTDSISKEILVGRLVSVVFSLGTLINLYLLGVIFYGSFSGFFSGLFFAIAPFSVYYSRVILPEPLLLFFLTLALLLNALAFLKSKTYLIGLSGLFFALSLLVKPYALFLLPLFIVTPIILPPKRSLGLFLYNALVFGLSLLPLYWWRNWIASYPEGIPASDWLFNKDNIRLKPSFFHWLFEVRLGILILGIGLMVPFILGLIRKGKNQIYLLLLGICSLSYLIIIASGNVQHDYYQVFLLPFISLAIGRGITAFWELPESYLNRFFKLFSITLLFTWSLFVSWYNIRGYYQVNNGAIIEAGEATNGLTPSSAKVIAPYFGDTAFLFATNRTGWPIGYDIEDKIKKGATHYVSVVYDDEARELEKKYSVISKTEKYILIDLTKRK